MDKVNPIKLFDENKTIAGFHLRHLMSAQGCHDYIKTVVKKVFEMWQSGKIRPVIDSTWALEDVCISLFNLFSVPLQINLRYIFLLPLQVTEAMQKMHDRKNVGKITLDPAMEPKPKPTVRWKS